MAEEAGYAGCAANAPTTASVVRGSLPFTDLQPSEEADDGASPPAAPTPPPGAVRP